MKNTIRVILATLTLNIIFIIILTTPIPLISSQVVGSFEIREESISQNTQNNESTQIGYSPELPPQYSPEKSEKEGIFTKIKNLFKRFLDLFK